MPLSPGARWPPALTVTLPAAPTPLKMPPLLTVIGPASEPSTSICPALRHFAATLGPFLPDFPVPCLSRAEWNARFAGTDASVRRAAPVGAPTSRPVAANTPSPPPARSPLRGLLTPLTATAIAALVLGLALTPGVLVFPADRVHSPETDRMLEIAKGVAGQLEVRRRQLELALAEDCSALLKRQSTGSLLPPRPANVHVQMPPAAPGTPGAPNPPSQMVELPARVDGGTVIVVASHMFGSGFFIAADTIVTNRHVVGEEDRVRVANTAIGIVEAEVIARGGLAPAGSLNYDDFAVLRVPAQPKANPFHLAAPPERLQNVVAVGFPALAMTTDTAFDRLKRGDKSASSALNPVITEGQVNHLQPQPAAGATLVVHSAEVSPGNSGGPLVDLCGRVIGVNTFSLSDKTMTWRYALGSDGLRRFLQSAKLNAPFDGAPCTPLIVAAASPPAEAVKAPAPAPPLPPANKRN